jgi:hypothetical protein
MSLSAISGPPIDPLPDQRRGARLLRPTGLVCGTTNQRLKFQELSRRPECWAPVACKGRVQRQER